MKNGSIGQAIIDLTGSLNSKINFVILGATDFGINNSWWIISIKCYEKIHDKQQEQFNEMVNKIKDLESLVARKVFKQEKRNGRT